MENPVQLHTTDTPGEFPSVQTPHQASRQEAAKRKKRLLLIIAASAAILLLAAGAFWFFTMRNDAKKPNNAGTNAQAKDQNTAPETPADDTPVVHKNAKLNIEITHRKDWTLKETSGGSEIILTSPSTTYTRADATAATTVFTLKIRKGVPENMKETVEKAVAVRDSEVIAYAAPTESQRQYTNLSYAGNDDMFKFFIVTGSVELKSGSPFQYALSLVEDTYLLAGGYGTDKNGSLTFDPVDKNAIDTPAKEQAVDIVESLKIF